MSIPSEHPSRQQVAGAALLFAGIGLWLLILLDMTIELPIDMPRSWYLHRPLWGLIGLCLFGAGWRLQSAPPRTPAGWSASPPGRRFRRLVVYSRAACHLCDDAKAVLALYLDYLPDLEEIDIDTRPELQERFGTSIPVVEIDGEIRFRGRVDEILLRRLIEGTPPIPRGGSDADD
jgi:glutaredoxin